MLKNLPFKPGIYTDDTARDVGKLGFWKSCDKVRFYEGAPTKIGGWTKSASDSAFLGTARGSHDWSTYRFEVNLVFGTNLKLYVWTGGTFYNVTPIRETGTLTDPFTTTINLYTVLVSDTAHGLLAGDYVTFSGASAVGGITISGEYTVTSRVSADAYYITHSAPATSTAGPGGGSVTYSYEIPIGRADSIAGLGWGANEWSGGYWGVPRNVVDFLAQARTWSIDQWGEDVVCNYRGGGIYVWDSSAGTGTRATLISQAPTTTASIMVSSEDRHLIALGAHDGVANNPMYVRWCAQENYTDWTASLTNTAGAKLLDMGNVILKGVKVRGEHLIFTDWSIYSMVFVGPPDTFSFRTLGDNGGLVGPMAVHVFEGVAYWMGEQNFFMYDGVTKVIPCTVNSIFDRVNPDQKVKIYAGINRRFREVWWLYPSVDSAEVDSYVIYSLNDGSWSLGTLDRTMLIGDSDILYETYGFSPDGYIYTHESGNSENGAPMNAYIESGDVEADLDGNELAHISKFVPDFTTFTGNADVTITGKKYPRATETQVSGPHTITPTTQFINPRVRCRQLSIKVESTGVDDSWQLGMMRVDLIPHGRR